MSVNVFNKTTSSLIPVSGNAEGLPVFNITEAQYNAQKSYYDNLDAVVVLTDVDTPEKLNKVNPNGEGDLTMSGDITDGSGNTLSDVADTVKDYIEYSTDEVVVGKWIDGKTLYRRIVTGTASATGNNVLASIPNIQIKKFEGIISRSNGTYINPIGYVPYSSSTTDYIKYITTWNYVSSTGNINIQVGASMLGDVMVIIEYTKTTD